MKHRVTKISLFYLFMKGFLSFFMLDKNPIGEYARQQKKVCDSDKIYSDWCKVGNDIRSAYEKYGQVATK